MMSQATTPETTPDREPTAEQYAAFRLLFDHFNGELFGATLPRVLLTFSRIGSHRTIAFFVPKHWRGVGADPALTHEISLCPAFVAANTFRDTCASLVHEMCHLWQEEYGKPPRKGYHSREWSEKMLAVGLRPLDSRNGKPAMSAPNMSHEIIADGGFDRAFATLQPAAVLPWSCVAARAQRKPDEGNEGEGGDEGEDSEGGGKPTAPAPSKNKIKYTCPTCGANAWGKPGLSLACLGGGEEIHSPAMLGAVV